MLILREIVAEPHAEPGGVPWTRSGHAPGRVFLAKNQSICVNAKSESADRLYFL